MRLRRNFLDRLSKLGSHSDLEFTIAMDLRRGLVRAIVVTAGSPMDSIQDRHPCGWVCEEDRDLIEVIEALAIESAVRWTQPAIPGFDLVPLKWFDGRALGLLPAGRP
jgi:hypothetical protein